MAAPTYTPLPTAPARTMTPTAFAAAADAFVAALAAFQTEGDTLGAYTQTQAEAALAAAIAGNLSGLDLTALAGWVIGVNTAGDALEGVELVPPSNATTTAAGIVEKATTAEAQGGTTGDKFMDDVLTKAAILALSPISAKPFVSTGQTITSAALLTIAHSLGAKPPLYNFYIKCTTAEHGWSIGDEIELGSNLNMTDLGTNRASPVYTDATNIYIQFTNTATVILQANKATGAAAAFTNANWDIYVRAWA